jgi:transcriptional regulator with XRE-family HTH domain
MSTKHKAKKHIGHLIRDVRIRRGLKADDVAEFCNVSRSRVYSWEQSTSVLPKNLKSLSAALKIPLKRLQSENRHS